MELIPSQIGPYRVENEIARGQTVFVFRAFDTLYERYVALKVYPPYLSSEIEQIRAFISEGREATRLRHPNILQTYDAGLTDGYHYVAQALAASSLASVLAEANDLPIAPSIELLEQISAALDYAHKQEIIHGNLIPNNILLTEDGRPLLTNFDFEGRRSATLTADSGLPKIERLAYLPPEQAKGDITVDSKSDIYALGVIAYQLLTGKLPFLGENALAILYAINHGAPSTPSSLQVELPPQVDSVVLRALERTPSFRWHSAGDFVSALSKANQGETAAAPLHMDESTATMAAMESATVKPQSFTEEKLDSVGSTISENPTETQLQTEVSAESKQVAKITPLIGLRTVDRKQPPPQTKHKERTIGWAGIAVGLTAAVLMFLAGLALMRGSTWSGIVTDERETPVEGDQEIVVPGPEEPSNAADMMEGNHEETNENTNVTQSAGINRDEAEVAASDSAELVNLSNELVDNAITESSSAARDSDSPPMAALVALDQPATSDPIPAKTGANMPDTPTPTPTSIPEEPPTAVPTNTPTPIVPTETPTTVPPTSTPTETPTVPAEVVFASTEGEADVASTDAGIGHAAPDDDFQAIEEQVTPEGVDLSALYGRIAYALWNPRTLSMDTYIYAIGSGVMPQPLVNKRQPDFRADGWLAYNGEGGGLDNILRTRSEGQNGVVISAHPEDSRPHWSPTGKQFVFDSTFMGDRRHRIYLSNDINEKEEEIAVELKPVMYNFWELFGRYPIFLSNGQIAYQGCNVWLNGGSCGIYRINGVGSEPQQVTYWPSDIPTDNLGDEILYMSNQEESSHGDNWEIYRVRGDGSGLVRLTNHPAHDGLATASPDGNHIAFVSDRDGGWAIYVMDRDGHGQQLLFELNGQFGPGAQYWQYDWKQERLSWGN